SLPGRDGEGVRNVTYRLDTALVVDDDGDDVEATGRLPQPLQLEISVGELREPVLLARLNGRLGGIPLELAPCLDLDEHERPALFRHEIDLAGARANVLVQDRVAAPREEPGGFLLSSDSCPSSTIDGHGATP